MIEGVSQDWRQVTSTLSVHTFSVHTHTIWHVTFTSTRQPGLQTSLVSWRNVFFLPRVSWALLPSSALCTVNLVQLVCCRGNEESTPSVPEDLLFFADGGRTPRLTILPTIHASLRLGMNFPLAPSLAIRVPHAPFPYLRPISVTLVPRSKFRTQLESPNSLKIDIPGRSWSQSSTIGAWITST